MRFNCLELDMYVLLLLFLPVGCSQPCQQGRWGHNCESQCQCRNGATCDSVSGRCICAPGWTGRRCAEGKTVLYHNKDIGKVLDWGVQNEPWAVLSVKMNHGQFYQ